ncbi:MULTISPECIES: 2-hydroxyglutaryl-CoA dehydratase [Sorangium]|uniref:Activator of 2-hydroxyglutaryl-CoA dehydratase n=1 Tax=Sorangium cellulosum (strain So ce56) TaxID=448385 RepID=A9GH32_SORC5|nr:2-hydroxyglutaryl-CoA dehydratase [Sorangium cellulosum]CAN96405.1 Putative activator of 2-hydroxyglutaryl-CoA dehydratase [Sorangium cellulosum So ce56]
MQHTSTTSTTTTQKTRLPLAGETRSIKTDVDIEAELRAFEEAERERLGLKAERRQWVDNMLKPKMTKKERENVTLLISGLTAAQDFLCEGALKGLGYNVHYFGMSDNAGLQTGKEFGNRGQCNPTYFTVGGLVKYLIDLRDKQGMSTEDIIKNYVFLTAGACGPCRFGMYVTEYRKALRDAGFDGFRVMLFQQTGGLSQATGDDVGLEMNPAFFIAIIKAIVCGDTLNALGYRIRPYEVEPGATNRAMESAKRILYKALYEQTNVFKALYEARKEFEGVRVDKLRPKAKTSIIGEFWAMTTEGDGNYALQKFLESEGGENDIQLTTAWLLYNIWECARDTRERRDLRGADEGNYGLASLDEFGVAKRLATMRLAEGALRVGFQAFALPLGLFDYHLPDMELVAEVAKDYYSNDLRGGEGHMEVGKLIVNAVKSKAHLTVSVKPFGCMPSSGVSDGVQSLITARYPGTIFCAVETSGDGATNFYSRIQMYMFKARILAEQELTRAYEEAGVTEAEVRAFLARNPKYASPLHHAPHRVAGSAANLVYEVAPLIKQTAAERAVGKARAAAGALRDAVKAAPAKAKAAKEFLTDPETLARAREDVALIRDIVGGKAAERFSPLVKRLAGKAYFENNPEVRHVSHGANSVEPIAAE